MACLRALAANGVASIAALHDLGLAARFADRVILLADGQIVAQGTPREVLTEARLANVYNVDLAVTQIDGVPVFVPRGARLVQPEPGATV